MSILKKKTFKNKNSKDKGSSQRDRIHWKINGRLRNYSNQMKRLCQEERVSLLHIKEITNKDLLESIAYSGLQRPTREKNL